MSNLITQGNRFSSVSLDFGSSNSNKELSCASSASLDFGSAMTASMWVNAPATSSIYVAMAKYNTTGNKRGFRIRTTGNATTNVLQVYLSADGGNVNLKLYQGSQNVLDSTWHHFAYTFNTNVLKLYVDGTLDSSPTKTTDGTVNSIFFDSGVSFYLGRDSAGQFWHNKMDVVSLWNTDLTATDISNIYNSGRPANLTTHAKAANLVSWWRMGEGSDSATTVYDVGGSSNDLTGANLASTDFVNSSA